MSKLKESQFEALPETVSAETEPSFIETEMFWRVGSIIVLLVTAVLRFYWIGLKVFHHDEGVNGFFLTTLVRQGVYKYDPANYHGPTLYYFALASNYLFGLNDFAVRFVTSTSGVLIVVSVLYLRRYLGTIGALTAGLLVAVSPGMSFISRYFIHEMIFVFFTFGVVLAVIKFMESERAGNIAIGAMTMLLLICLLPGTLNFANSVVVSEENRLIARIIFFAVEIAIVFFLMRSLAAWENGRPIYLLLAAASAVLTFATKETAFISFGTMLIALFCIWLWTKLTAKEPTAKTFLQLGLIAIHGAILALIIYRFKDISDYARWFLASLTGQLESHENIGLLWALVALGVLAVIVWTNLSLDIWQNKKLQLRWTDRVPLSFKTFRESFGGLPNAILLIVLCWIVFGYVGALFFSSFFTYPGGISGAFEAYNIWAKTGSKDHTQNGTFAYLIWLLKIEAPILILAALGALIAFWKGKHRFAMFAALWAFGLFAAYTIIPYKTPWLAVNFIMPMCLIAGYGINELAHSRDSFVRALARSLAALSIAVCTYQAIDLNFYRYDDDTRPYVYAHTKRGFLDLVREIERIAQVSGKGKETSIIVASNEYWGLPWYLRDYSSAGFYGQITPASTAEIVVGNVEQKEELEAEYGRYYTHTGTYPLRPGVDLMLYVRKDLVGK